MKRILQIIASLRIGGAEKVSFDIGLASLAKGDAVDYLVFGNEIGDYESEIVSKGGRVIHIDSPFKNYRKYLQTLESLMHENHYDVVHAHTMFNIGWAMLAASKTGVPIRISHAHSALNDGHRLVKQVYEFAMRRLILRHSTHLIACGDKAGVRLYGKKGYRNSGICILNGINTSEFAFNAEKRNAVRRELGLQNEFVIGHVGHLDDEVKNQSFLIRLMHEILKVKPNTRLILLGEGKDRQRLTQLIQDKRLENHVFLIGNVRNVPDYLSAMDVFAFPSFYEGMPLSILEVQANGLPCVISTGVPNDVFLTDLIQPISLADSKQWVQAICNAQRRNPGRYANEMNEKGFDTKRVIQKFLDIYERTDTQ